LWVFHVSLHLSFRRKDGCCFNTYWFGCAFYAAGECMGAFSYLANIASLLLLWLLGLSELCVFPPVLFFIGLELVPDLVLGEVCDLLAEVHDLLVVRLPKILIDSCLSTCCCIMFCCYCFSVVVLAVVSWCVHPCALLLTISVHSIFRDNAQSCSLTSATIVYLLVFLSINLMLLIHDVLLLLLLLSLFHAVNLMLLFYHALCCCCCCCYMCYVLLCCLPFMFVSLDVVVSGFVAYHPVLCCCLPSCFLSVNLLVLFHALINLVLLCCAHRWWSVVYLVVGVVACSILAIISLWVHSY
jgi:hypothetical protein